MCSPKNRGLVEKAGINQQKYLKICHNIERAVKINRNILVV